MISESMKLKEKVYIEKEPENQALGSSTILGSRSPAKENEKEWPMNEKNRRSMRHQRSLEKEWSIL